MLHARIRVSRFLLPRSWRPVRCANSAAGHSHDPNGTSVSEGHHNDPPFVKTRGLTAFIRTTKFIESPADVFAIIRAVERKYGALTEYRFLRDFEIGTKYQSVAYVVFRDPQSPLRISADSDILHIPAPHIIPDRPGGIGLDELEGLLEPQENAKEGGIPAFENVMESVLQSGRDEKNDRVIECKIQRSNFDFLTLSRPGTAGYTRRFLDVTARNFIDWCGFYDIKPIEKGRIANEDLFNAWHIDHLRMRRTIRKWSDVAGVPNPYEYTHGSEQVIEQLPRTDNHVEWEPLPGYESSTEDVPSSVEVTSQPQYPPPTVPSMSATPNNPIVAPSSPSADPQKLSHNSTPPPIMPSDAQSETSNLMDIPTQTTSPIPRTQICSGTPSSSARSKKAAQLKAARNLAKHVQQQQKKQNPAKLLSSKPTPAQNSSLIRPPVRPAPEKQNSTATERLKGFFKTWF